MDRITKLRPITPEDEDFLYRVYASTREDELAPLDWDDEQKESFLKMQFAAQHKFYTEQFPRAEFQVILLDQEPIGRLYLDHRDDEIRLIDIALLPAHRNRGIGNSILKDILAAGELASLPVRIHVEQFNPALRFYKRLGFRQTGDDGIYYLMEWSPGSTDTKNAR